MIFTNAFNRIFKGSQNTNPGEMDQEIESEPKIDRNLFLEDELYLGEHPSGEANKDDTSFLETIKRNMGDLTELSMENDGFNDALLMADNTHKNSRLVEIKRFFIMKIEKDVDGLQSEVIDIQRAIIQLEESKLNDLAFKLEGVKFQLESYLNECKRQLDLVEKSKGWVSYQLITYDRGFRKALGIQLVKDYLTT